jgi:hypothetical protein
VAWELMREVVRNLGRGWGIEASGLQDLGYFIGDAPGPGGMRLRFCARTEKIDPRDHHSPPLGQLRVNGRIWLDDKDLDAEISITLEQSLSAQEMANEIIVRLLPLYAGFLSVVEKHNLELGRQA